jgi:hypothetical protein
MCSVTVLASFGIALLLFLAVVAGTLQLNSLDYSWESWRPAICMPDACFCERLRSTTVRQPVNTLTNLSFVLLGLVVMAMANVDASRSNSSASLRRVVATPFYTLTYGLAVLLIGVGGTFYHASMTFVGLWLDLMGMYLLANFMLLFSFSRLGRFTPRAFALWYLIANLASAGLLTAWPEVGRHTFGLILLMAFISDFAVRSKLRVVIDTRLLFGAIGLLGIAFAIWTLDLTGMLCAPESWLQGHGLWHVLTALAAGLIYLYFRSERAPTHSSLAV